MFIKVTLISKIKKFVLLSTFKLKSKKNKTLKIIIFINIIYKIKYLVKISNNHSKINNNFQVTLKCMNNNNFRISIILINNNKINNSFLHTNNNNFKINFQIKIIFHNSLQNKCNNSLKIIK